MEAIDVAEQIDGELIPIGQVRFGLWVLCQMFDALRSGPASRHRVIPVAPLILGDVKFFGRQAIRLAFAEPTGWQ